MCVIKQLSDVNPSTTKRGQANSAVFTIGQNYAKLCKRRAASTLALYCTSRLLKNAAKTANTPFCASLSYVYTTVQ